MSTYETLATVEDQGRVLLAGLPFAAGTEVAITVVPKQGPEVEVTNTGNGVAENEDIALAAARARMQALFQAIHGFRASPSIPREELHERGSVR